MDRVSVHRAPRDMILMHHPTFTRRAMLQAGAAGILGLGSGELAALRAGNPDPAEPQARRVVYVFLSGGLAQATASI
jgi:hypothetical protein